MHQASDVSALYPAPAARLNTWTQGLGPDTEAGLVNAAAAGNISAAFGHLLQLFTAADFIEDHVSSLQALVAPFPTSELLNFLQAFKNADFTDADLAVLEEIF